MVKVNIFENKLVPSHRLLSDEEKKGLLSELGIRTIQLPKILASDSAIKNLKAKPGDVIEIERKSQTAVNSKYYRVVVVG